MSGIFKAKERPLAKEVPTSKDPIKPGPRVKAMALISVSFLPLLFTAASITGIIFCWCARDASSGNTPPHCSCMDCEAVMLERIFPFSHKDTAVSSQDDSMPSIVIDTYAKVNFKNE